MAMLSVASCSQSHETDSHRHPAGAHFIVIEFQLPQQQGHMVTEAAGVMPPCCLQMTGAHSVSGAFPEAALYSHHSNSFSILEATVKDQV